MLEPLHADPQNLLDTIRRVVDEVRAGHNPLRENGVAGLLATPEQRLAIGISGMMSLLEGHGDVVMDRAGAAEVPARPGSPRCSTIAGPIRGAWPGS